MRPMLGVVLAVLGTALAANILAEYEFDGYVPWMGALAVAVLVAWLLGSVGQWRGWPAAAVGAAIAGAGFLWSGWIETDGGVEPYAATTWVAGVLAAIVAAAQLMPRRSSAP